MSTDAIPVNPGTDRRGRRPERRRPRTPRLYSLFEKVGRRWERRSSLAYPKRAAVRIFQDRLLESFFSGRPLELRPVK